MSLSCERIGEIEAYADAEVDALKAQQLEQHLAGCAACAAHLASLMSLRRRLAPLRSMNTPPESAARIARALDRETAGATAAVGWRVRMSEWLRAPAPAAALGVLAGIGLAVAFGLQHPWSLPGERIADELLTDHLRSLTANHLLDVPSSDHHTVKPWFAGNADVSPEVTDFTAAGFTLLGGRVDVIDGRRAAVLVYRHGAHVINVFSWGGAEAQLPGGRVREGYRIRCWRSGDLNDCAVSDAAPEELEKLERLMRAPT
jgi:anti-sigma factor RsiW